MCVDNRYGKPYKTYFGEDNNDIFKCYDERKRIFFYNIWNRLKKIKKDYENYENSTKCLIFKKKKKVKWK